MVLFPSQCHSIHTYCLDKSLLDTAQKSYVCMYSMEQACQWKRNRLFLETLSKELGESGIIILTVGTFLHIFIANFLSDPWVSLLDLSL